MTHRFPLLVFHLGNEMTQKYYPEDHAESPKKPCINIKVESC